MIKIESSNAQIPPGKLAVTLLVTALCSQLLPFGSLLFVAAAVANAIGGGPQNDVWIYLGLVLIPAGPLLLGLYLKPGWRGIGIGLLGLLGTFGGYLLDDLAEQLTTPFTLITAQSLSSKSIGLSTIPFAAGGVMVILLVAGKVKDLREFAGVAIAIFFSILMSIGLANMIAIIPAFDASYREGGGAESLPIFLSFLWLWLSAVFFPELLSRRTDWRGLFIWIAAILIFTIVIFSVALGLGQYSG